MTKTRLAAIVVALAAATLWLWTARFDGAAGLTAGGLLAVVVFGKAAVAIASRPRAVARTKSMTIAVVMPFYNEQDDSLRATLNSILAQSRKPDHLLIVNDGSSTGDGAVRQLLPRLRATLPAVTYEVFEQNQGKRAALAAAIRQCETDVVITTDSDTILADDAIEELIKPLARYGVMGVTGRVLVANRSRNILTRVQNLLYTAAFLNERAALSVVGKVMICSGAISGYRREALVPHLEEFLSRPRMFGEDRQLTSFAHLHGKVVFQESARAWTRVPETVDHYARQQLRWYRGDVQNSLWIAKHAPLGGTLLWLTFCYFAISVVFLTLLSLALFNVVTVDQRQVMFDSYVLYTALLSWVSLGRYLEPGDQPDRAERFLMFAFAPAIGVLHALLLCPVRLYALVTFNSRGWGSRRRIPAGDIERRQLHDTAVAS